MVGKKYDTSDLLSFPYHTKGIIHRNNIQLYHNSKLSALMMPVKWENSHIFL